MRRGAWRATPCTLPHSLSAQAGGRTAGLARAERLGRQSWGAHPGCLGACPLLSQPRSCSTPQALGRGVLAQPACCSLMKTFHFKLDPEVAFKPDSPGTNTGRQRLLSPLSGDRGKAQRAGSRGRLPTPAVALTPKRMKGTGPAPSQAWCPEPMRNRVSAPHSISDPGEAVGRVQQLREALVWAQFSPAAAAGPWRSPDVCHGV